MLRKLFFILTLVTLSVVTAVNAGVAAKRNTYVTVAAGEFDRADSVVSFDLPPELKGNAYALKDSAGRITPAQIDYRRQVSFVVGNMKAGESNTYQLIAVAETQSTNAVKLVRRGENLDLLISNRKAFSFVGKPQGLPEAGIQPVFLRGGYIHPVYAPSGRVVTDDYPSDHYHHHGIWFAWTKTQFEGGHPDFWNVQDGTGRIDFEATGKTWSGPVHGGFLSRQNYIALTGQEPKTALNEEWDVRLYQVGQGAEKFFMFDLVATQNCATTSPLILDEYRYGGMGIRGHRDWKDKSKVTFLTSEGKTRSDGNATRGRWFRMSGPVTGEIIGIAVLDHPANFRSPQAMRLNPDDPFFNYAPSQLGAFKIQPGEKFVLRYRYIVSDGEANVGQLNRLWNDYAHPPTVAVSTK